MILHILFVMVTWVFKNNKINYIKYKYIYDSCIIQEKHNV